ncbi:MAG TPA: NAD(P)-dependent oxidoreductase [Alphaproteobacteria bacterium]|nr:NAD(P)-dependent oxidoreductase [Alphaproteobacteria bacterium]
MQKILITGAAGGVGRRLRRLLRGRFPAIRLSDVARPADVAPGEEFMQADLADFAAVEKTVAGVEGIVHLGGMSVENDWETILASNIVGTRNVFEAARRQGVKRVVFATSNHVVGFYPRSRRIGTEVLVRPDSRYGVSKAFGEALGSFYADKFGLRVFCIRIGNVDDRPVDKRRLSIWLHPEDLAQLVCIGLEHPDVHYEVVYGASDNERGWWDNETAFRFGYRPKGRAEDFADAALAAQKSLPSDPLGDQFQGGSFCSAEFAGDPERLV